MEQNKNERAHAGSVEPKAWEYMEAVNKAVTEAPLDDVESVLRGMVLSMAVIIAGYGKARNTGTGRLRREVLGWIFDKDYGLGFAGRTTGSPADRTIFLPSDEQLGQMMENAWQSFGKDAAENGFMSDGEDIRGIIKDILMAGYSYGYSDCLGIIRGQLQAIDMANGGDAGKGEGRP